jgi:pimeloyl-ACP methyl ester carboxylesterase
MKLADRKEVSHATEQAAVLVHGLWMTGWVLYLQKRRLERCGFRTYLFSYSTVRKNIEHNASELVRFIEGIAESRIYLIGHSLGGLLILRMMKESPDPRVERVVLMGSPYGDCQAGRAFGEWKAGRYLLGKTLSEWMQSEKAPWVRNAELGVIAGSRRLGLGMLFTRFESENDGVVTVEETKVPGMSDHIVLEVGHSEMMFSSRVIDAACEFFRHGRFMRKKG